MTRAQAARSNCTDGPLAAERRTPGVGSSFCARDAGSLNPAGWRSPGPPAVAPAYRARGPAAVGPLLPDPNNETRPARVRRRIRLSSSVGLVYRGQDHNWIPRNDEAAHRGARYASRFTMTGSRFTIHDSRWTIHVGRFTMDESRAARVSLPVTWPANRLPIDRPASLTNLSGQRRRPRSRRNRHRYRAARQ